MQLILFCDLLSGDIWVFYHVWSNRKNCGHITQFIQLPFILFSTSAFLREIFFALEERLPFSLFLKKRFLPTNCGSHLVHRCLFQNTRFFHPYKISRSLYSKFNPFHHNFIRSKPSATKLVKYLAFITIYFLILATHLFHILTSAKCLNQFCMICSFEH